MTTATDKTDLTSEATTIPGPEARPSGLARIRNMEKWQRAGLMAEAAHEGNKLCDQISRAVSDAYFSDSSSALNRALSPDILDQANEAVRLLTLAIDYLRDLTWHQDEPPF